MSDVKLNAEEIEADATRPEGDINNVRRKAEELLQAYEDLEVLEKQVKEKAEQIRQIEVKELPDVMQSCNMEEFTLEDGFKIKIKNIVKAGLPTKGAIEKEKDETRKAELQHKLNFGLQWLRDNGGEELIKNTVAIEFSKGQDNIVGDFIGKAEEMKLPYNRQQSVHPSTLSTFVKEKMKKGTNIPKEELGVYCGRKAEVKKSR